MPDSTPTIIVTDAGAKFAVRVAPPGPVDHDRAFSAYPSARSYAGALLEALGEATLDDRCERPRGDRA